MNNAKALVAVILGLVVIGVAVAFLPKQAKGEYDDYDVAGLVSCLNEKEAVIYASYSCSYCQKQKKEFGSAFSEVNYVECSTDTQKCVDANIQGTPTWIFGDGSRIEGYLPLPQFAEKAGCPLVKKE